MVVNIKGTSPSKKY